MLLTMNDPPTVNAGTVMNMCNDKLITINDAVAANFSSLLWTSTTAGTFSTPTDTSTTYTPAPADILANIATLTLTAKAKPSCVNASSTKTINLFKPVTADAGGDNTICYNSKYPFVKDIATNATTLLWQITSGKGSFDFTDKLHPTYTLDPADITAGFVQLNLQATGSANCDPVSSAMTLNIDKGPQIDAGPD